MFKLSSGFPLLCCCPAVHTMQSCLVEQFGSMASFSCMELFLGLQPWLDTLPTPEVLVLPPSLLGSPAVATSLPEEGPASLQALASPTDLQMFFGAGLSLSMPLPLYMLVSVFVLVSVLESVPVSVLVSVLVSVYVSVSLLL
jgi:hypothetical protein